MSKMYPLKRHDHLRSTQRRRMKTNPACCVTEVANITNAASKDSFGGVDSVAGASDVDDVLFRVRHVSM